MPQKVVPHDKEWNGLVPGLMTFSAGAGGYATVRHFIRLEPGKTLNLGTVRLHKPLSIKGKVVDEAGNPVKFSMTVRNLDQIKFPQPLSMGMSTPTKTGGTFEARGIQPGRYILQFGERGYANQSAMVTVGESSVEGVELVLKRGANVTFKTHLKPTDYFFLQITNSEGLQVVGRHLWGSWDLDYELVPGNYTVTILEDLKVVESKPLRVGKNSLSIDLLK